MTDIQAQGHIRTDNSAVIAELETKYNELQRVHAENIVYAKELEAELKVHLENLNEQDAKIDRLEAEKAANWPEVTIAYANLKTLAQAVVKARKELGECYPHHNEYADAVVADMFAHKELAALLEADDE